jgi:hypothetical protein
MLIDAGLCLWGGCLKGLLCGYSHSFECLRHVIHLSEDRVKRRWGCGKGGSVIFISTRDIYHAYRTNIKNECGIKMSFLFQAVDSEFKRSSRAVAGSATRPGVEVQADRAFDHHLLHILNRLRSI